MSARQRPTPTGMFALVVALLHRILDARPSARRTFGVVLATVTLAAAVTAVQTSVASAAPAPPFNGTPPVLDGRLDPLYASNAAEVEYTQTGAAPKVINGSLAVIETADAYYLGFQQGLNRKSNAYCQNKKNTPDCYQDFGALVGSDHISFEWPALDGRAFEIGVDIITADATAPLGYSGKVRSSNRSIGEGDDPLGCTDPTGLTGFSGEDYNWHHAGGTGYGADPSAELDSPNFAGKAAQYPDYVYASTAEVRIDKAKCGLANGLDLYAGLTMVAHNSPAAPTAANPAEFIVCAAGNPATGTPGVESTLTFNVLQSDALGNLVPNPGKNVLVSVLDGPGTLTSVNGVAGATSGTSSNPAGTVTAGITSAAAGTSNVRAVLDLNNNGVWDQGVEPSTNPACPITFAGTPPDMKITKSANVAAVNAPGTITYTIAVNNAGGSPATAVAISDDLDDDLVITNATWQVGGGGANGLCTFVAGNILTCSVGSLAANDNAAGGPDSATATITVAASAAACPSVLNQAHVLATNEAAGQQTDTQANPTGDNWSLPVTVMVNCPPPPPVIAVDLIKTNDANVDGTFTKSEVAPTQGAAVPFHLEIRNTSTVTVKIDSLTDTWPGHAIDNVCAALIGQTLAPYVPANNGPTLTCDFTEAGYAPASADPAKVNTARVDVSNAANPAQTAFDEDTSVVTTLPPPPPPVISVTLVKTNDADVDGTFTDAELAPTVGADVNFRGVIHNTSAVPVQILTLTDAFPAHAAAGVCAPLIGTVLAADDNLAGGPDEVTCNWTEPAYSWAPNLGAKVNIAAVTVGEVGNPGNTASDQDTSAVTTATPPPPVITVTLVKTNDADVDGTFTDAELAPTVGADVNFRGVIHNTSAVPVQILTLTDAFPAHAAAGVCAPLIGTVLAADDNLAGGPDEVTCSWTEPAYAPAAGAAAKVNTAAVVVSEVGNAANTATDEDTSSVTTPNQPPPPAISVQIVKTNDANGDGTYHDAEVAPTQGASVPFRAEITNTSRVAVEITKLTDLLPGAATADSVCAALKGTVLQPGDAVTCDFTLAGYAPASSDPAKVNTASVTVAQVGNLGNTASDDDTSSVTTPPPPVIAVQIVKTNDADGDGTFHEAEVAPVEGADVPFMAVITNNSAVPVVIVSLTDLLPGVANADDLCPALLGTVLQPNGTATCTWTESGYAPAPDAPAKVNTASVTVTEVDHPGNTATAQDTSSVTTPTLPPPPPPVLTITVEKTNDADGDGTFTDDEIAPQGSSVAFRALITNTSAVAVVIDSISDIWPGAVGILPCDELIGTVLQPGQSVVCNFTVAGYVAPVADGPKVNTVTVGVHQDQHPDNVASANDVSTVRSSGVQGEVVTKAPQAPPAVSSAQALPTTGAGTAGLLFMGLTLLAVGGFLLLVSSRLPSALALRVRRSGLIYSSGQPTIYRSVAYRDPYGRHDSTGRWASRRWSRQRRP